MSDVNPVNGHGANAADPEMPESVRQLAEELLSRTDELAGGMAAELHRQIPELGSDAELLAETRASCASNIEQSYRLMHAGLRADSLAVTHEAREYVRGLVSRGIKVPVLLRTYRLGHAWIWELWTEQLREMVDDQQELARAIEYSSRWMFSYIDLVSAELVEEFAGEQARRMRSAEQLRADTVQAILAGEPLDEEAASRRLGYQLRRRHLAMHLSSTADEPGGLERCAGELAGLLGAGSPLMVATGANSFDVWCALPSAADVDPLDVLRAYRPPKGVAVAAGGCAKGVTGFKNSHDEARQAARVAALGQQSAGEPGGVTIYEDVELAALLSADEQRARRFVKQQLGELGVADEQTARLRATVLAYLRCNRSTSQAAKQLYVHQNTVTYRLRRAEELLGRAVTEGTPELLCALILDAALGPPPRPATAADGPASPRKSP